MQLHQLEYFVAVADEGGFTRGAQRLRIVQSAVSAGIAQLEQELGVNLFTRGHRQIVLTHEGEVLLPRVREALAAVQAVTDTANQARGVVAGLVRLGVMEYLGSIDLLGVLERLQREHPGIVVQLRQTVEGTRTSLEAVRSGILDLAIVGTSSPAHDLDVKKISEEPLVFVLPATHRLATKKKVTLPDFADEPFIEYPLGWGNRTATDQLFAGAGISRTIRTEVTHFDLALDLVARDLGVTVVPGGAVREHPGIVTIPVVDAPLWHVGLALPARRSLSEAAHTLLRYLVRPEIQRQSRLVAASAARDDTMDFLDAVTADLLNGLPD